MCLDSGPAIPSMVRPVFLGLIPFSTCPVSNMATWVAALEARVSLFLNQSSNTSPASGHSPRATHLPTPKSLGVSRTSLYTTQYGCGRLRSGPRRDGINGIKSVSVTIAAPRSRLRGAVGRASLLGTAMRCTNSLHGRTTSHCARLSRHLPDEVELFSTHYIVIQATQIIYFPLFFESLFPLSNLA